MGSWVLVLGITESALTAHSLGHSPACPFASTGKLNHKSHSRGACLVLFISSSQPAAPPAGPELLACGDWRGIVQMRRGRSRTAAQGSYGRAVLPQPRSLCFSFIYEQETRLNAECTGWLGGVSACSAPHTRAQSLAASDGLGLPPLSSLIPPSSMPRRLLRLSKCFLDE